MPKRIDRQPFHEPVGLSPEGTTTSRRLILTLFVTLVVMAAGIVAWIRLS